MKKSILALGKTLSKESQVAINGGINSLQCLNVKCDELRGFFCNDTGRCEFQGFPE